MEHANFFALTEVDTILRNRIALVPIPTTRLFQFGNYLFRIIQFFVLQLKSIQHVKGQLTLYGLRVPKVRRNILDIELLHQVSDFNWRNLVFF